jgi:hypothetical protein
LRYLPVKRIPMHLLMVILFIILCRTAAGNEEKTVIRQSVHRFFSLVHQKKYEDAYNLFSRSVKSDVSYRMFVEGAQDVKYLKIQSIDIFDLENNLAKTRISTLIHLVHQDNLFEGVYEGQVSLYKERGTWKVLAVSLEAKSSKSLGRKVEAGQLQKLDFGTK